MTDKPTPTTDLLKRGVEIHEGRSTGVLSGEALRDYAKRKWPGRRDTLQMAEHETGTEALAMLAKWGQPAQPPTHAQAGAVPPTDGQIQDLLLCGNPTDEEMRLIRIGWDAARGIKGGQHVE
mgnify:CR=1 FL=1